jgi:two-component system nitrogen regulation sensor histidine kinase GlnL
MGSIVSGLEEAVIAIDKSGQVIYANPAAATLFGADPMREEIWADVLLRNRWLTAGLQTTLREGRSHVLHQVRLDLFLTSRTVGLRVSPHFNDKGELRGAICLLFDQTSLEALSENVRQLDKLQEFGVLAAGLAHEVKNPLGGIMGAAQLLRTEGLSKDALDCVELIERDVRRINRLIEELLNFGNHKKLVREETNLHQLIDQVLQGLRLDPVAAGHQFIRDFDPSLPPIPMHTDGIHQVLLNLVKNALEASDPGAPVVIKTRVDLATRRVAKRAVLIEVQNEGPKISDEVKAQLYTPFFTTKPVGTGLGLPVSLRIVRAHGGALDVLSEEGKTRFCLALPMEQPTA